MPDKAKTLKSWVRKVSWVFAGLVFLFLLTALILRIFITTKSGASFIESQINKRNLGPIERVEVLGLSGDPLNNFTIESMKFYDKDGVWLTASNVAIDWNPLALAREVLDINAVTSKGIDVVRRPKLNQTKASGELPVIQLNKASIEALRISESVIGRSAVFSLSGALNTEKSGVIRALLDVLRTDTVGDKLFLDFTRDDNGEMQGKFSLNGAPSGALTLLMGVPTDTAITGAGQVTGDMKSGQGDVVISFDDKDKLIAEGNWTDSQVKLQARVNTSEWPIFNSLRAGLGEKLDLKAIVNRKTSPAIFDIGLISPKLKATASGDLSPEGGLPTSAQITVETENIGGMISLPTGLKLGAGQVRGVLANKPNISFDGHVSVGDIISPYGVFASLGGPVQLTQQDTGLYQVKSQLLATDIKTDTALPFKLSPQTDVEFAASLDMDRTKVNNLNTKITSGSNQIKVSGGLDYHAMSYELNGNAEMTLMAIGVLPAGQLQSNFNVQKNSGSLPALKVSGAFKPDEIIKPPLDQVLTGGVNFDVDVTPIDGGVSIRNATLIGEAVKVAITGQVTNKYDIEGEGLITAPLRHEAISLSGESSASFRVMGNRAAPNILLDARSSYAEFNNYALESPQLRADISNILNAPRGPLRFTAETALGALDFSTNFASGERLYVADNIALSWGRLSASGNISKPVSAPATGRIKLNLPEKGEQYAKASLILSPKLGTQGISLSADAKNITYLDTSFDRFILEADGDISSLSGQLDTTGQRKLDVLERQFSVNSPFKIVRSDSQGYVAMLEPKANYGNIELGVTSPITARFNNGNIGLEAPLKLADSPLDIVYERGNEGEIFSMQSQGLPVSLIPMSGRLADTKGRLSANIELKRANATTDVKGGGTITLKDWRGFDVDKGSGLSGDLSFDIVNSQLNWKLEANTPSGFQADSKGGVPMLETGSISTLRPDMQSPLSGEFQASGQAAAILGLFTPNDAKPSGQIDVETLLSGTAANPQMEGKIEAQGLRMEAPDLGTQLRNGRFNARFTNDSLSVSDVSVTDNDKGLITGQGQFKLGKFARPIGELSLRAESFRALDRKDYEGTVSGKIDVKSTAKRATLTGDVTLDRAEVKQFVTGEGVTVIEIPVEEVNKPETLQGVSYDRVPIPVDIDIKVRAPRRVFIRSRGLDMELSLDSTLKGSLGALEIYGKATVLRGGYKIAGKELLFESGGIDFNGDLGASTVNLIANTDTQNLSASVVIKGTVESPEIELSSTPERPQDEILSALLFGRSATELSTIEAAQLAGALAQFSGAGGGFDLLGGLRDALGVGQLSIGLGEGGGAQITGGRYLAKNVYLQVFSGGGKEQTGAVIDWEIRKNISLTSKIQSDNDQSFSLKWKRDF